MLLVHKIQLKPNRDQEDFFVKSSDIARSASETAVGELEINNARPWQTFRSGH